MAVFVVEVRVKQQASNDALFLLDLFHLSFADDVTVQPIQNHVILSIIFGGVFSFVKQLGDDFQLILLV